MWRSLLDWLGVRREDCSEASLPPLPPPPASVDNDDDDNNICRGVAEKGSDSGGGGGATTTEWNNSRTTFGSWYRTLPRSPPRRNDTRMMIVRPLSPSSMTRTTSKGMPPPPLAGMEASWRYPCPCHPYVRSGAVINH